jgi:hypothetical protein
VNFRSPSSRALPLVFALLLLLLQSAAPLLHAHAADDPRDLAVPGFHLPGLETAPTATGARDVISDRFYPLIEETECCRQRLTHEAVAAASTNTPRGHPRGNEVRTPLRPAGWYAATDCAPPLPRAPPRPVLA